MVNVDIDKELYDKVKLIVNGNKLEYPSVRFFVQRSLLEKVEPKEDNNNGNLV